MIAGLKKHNESVIKKTEKPKQKDFYLSKQKNRDSFVYIVRYRKNGVIPPPTIQPTRRTKKRRKNSPLKTGKSY
jgi:hypothetical protein